MKYDILLPFRSYLNDTFSNKNTADRYYFATKKLLTGCHFNDLAELDTELIKKRLAATKTKHELSAAKNGLFHLETFCKEKTNLSPNRNFFTAESKKKFTMKTRSERIIRISRTKRKINAIRNCKLKYAYRLMLVSGLRIFEVAALTKNDITINGEDITVKVRSGKGGKSAEIQCITDPYLSHRLVKYLAEQSAGKKIFYSATTMRHQAAHLGFECHDLRRIAANTFRRQRLASGEKVYDANRQTSEFLRHERFGTTRRYLMGSNFNRKLIIQK